MIELIGVIYLAYSTYRIAKAYSVAKALLWFLAIVVGYVVFVYGGLVVILAVLGGLGFTKAGDWALLIALGLIFTAIGLVYLVHEHLLEFARIDKLESQHAISAARRRENLVPYEGEIFLVNFDPELHLISPRLSRLDNGSSIEIRYRENNSYFQDTITVDREFAMILENSQIAFGGTGRIDGTVIVVTGQLRFKETGVLVDVNDRLRC